MDIDKEELMYADKYYQQWLFCSYEYHYGDEDCVVMDDTFWDGLARLYVKYLNRYPYLLEIGFTGSTMGVGVNKSELLKECNNPRIIVWSY